MLRTITENMFDAVAGLTIIAAVFYLSAITHIVPLPENALKRRGEVSLDIMRMIAKLLELVRQAPIYLTKIKVSFPTNR